MKPNNKKSLELLTKKCLDLAEVWKARAKTARDEEKRDASMKHYASAALQCHNAELLEYVSLELQAVAILWKKRRKGI